MNSNQFVAALATATFVALIQIFFKPIVQRYLQKKNEFNYLLKELDDIGRHLRQNMKVMDNIVKCEKFPTLMHLEKLKIPEDSSIFSIETLKLSDAINASRIYEMKLKLRNLNIEIEDCIKHNDYEYDFLDFIKILRYHRYKTGLVECVLKKEIYNLASRNYNIAQISVNLSEIVPLPKKTGTPASSSVVSSLSRLSSRSHDDVGDDSAAPSPKTEDQGREQSTESTGKDLHGFN